MPRLGFCVNDDGGTVEPLAAGLRDEVVTEAIELALRSIDPDRLEHESLAAHEAIERLGKHLLRVARRLSSPSTPSALDEAVRTFNTAIDALGPDAKGDQVSLPPRLLKGVRAKAGLAAAALPRPPMIPLTSSELLVNGRGEPSLGKVLEQELRCSDEVDLICAFVGYTGFVPLRDEFRALIERGGRIRVITSTYLGSTSAKALDELVRLGAEVRVNYQGHATKLHAKAWLFRRPGQLDTAFVGSSNLSEAALYSGLEWNVRLARADAPGVFTRIQQTFDTYWETPAYEAYTLNDRARLDAALADAKGYAARSFGKQARSTIEELSRQLEEAYEHIHLHAKPHQQRVLDTLNLRRREFDEHRHLVVAATGTGKTVIAALDYARLCQEGWPRPRLLFLAHREQILEQARSTFRRALRDPSFGELLGSSGAISRDQHVFAMVPTVHNRLASVSPDAYDVIYVDEAHHGPAATWSRVIQHFAPTEIVGLTATPERTDGVSVATLFGGEYTTELRLWEAVNDQLLAPFDYVGIDDGTDLRTLAWHQGDYAVGALAQLYTGDHERVRRIVDAVHRWVERPQQMRALGFCVNVDHARFMAEQFQAHGFQAAYLTGDHGLDEREAALSRLEAGQLQAVFSVEILGEGVDVPDVDTLLLLRPTQSPVLFTQQLGRGLRNSEGKTSCQVLDFIGQHRAEYRFDERFQALIDTSQGTVREQAEKDFPFLPAGCAINLERIARDRVLQALRATIARPGLKAMTRDLINLQCGSLEDFLAQTGRSAERFYATDKRRMSWTRLQRVAGLADAPPVRESPELDDEEEGLLRRIGFLQHASDRLRTDTWFDWLTGPTQPDPRVMSVQEHRLATQLMHGLLLQPKSLAEGFDVLWRQPALRIEVAELLTLTHAHLDVAPSPMPDLPNVPLLAHARYSRSEVLAAVGASSIDKPLVHQQGVLLVPESDIQLMFVTLHKDESKFSSSTQYKDHALAPDLFHWESPNDWRQDSAGLLKCIGRGSGASRQRLLFVRERSTGAIEGRFRCFGQVDLDGGLTGERPVALVWRLRQPIPEVVFEAAQLVAAG